MKEGARKKEKWKKDRGRTEEREKDGSKEEGSEGGEEGREGWRERWLESRGAVRCGVEAASR